MAPPALSGGLATPLEPAPGARRAGVPGDPGGAQAAYRHGLQRFDAAVASSCGSGHADNEDAHSRLQGGGRLFVVADGVGGGAMAQLASRLLVAHLHAALESGAIDAARVGAAMLGADRALAHAIARVTDQPGAATVVLCAPVDASASQWLVGWVGDCRAYRWSPRDPARLALLSRDDSFANLGETPPPGGSPDDPARMVGNGATSGASVALHPLAPGELLALCSDGVHKHLDDAHWCAVLREPRTLLQRVDALLRLARARGSADDATLLLLGRLPVADTERSEP